MHKDDEIKHKDGYNYGDRKGHFNYTGYLPSVLYPRVRKYELENPEWCIEKGRFHE